MSIYVEEALAAIDKLEEFCQRYLSRFENGIASSELLHGVDDFEARIKDLLIILPPGVTLSEWERKVHFMRTYLRNQHPGECQGDLENFISDSLPGARKQVREWAAKLGSFDDDLRAKVAHLVRIRDFSSAIRAAFVVLTERMRGKYGLPTGLDGPALVNEIFGTKSTLTPHLIDKDKQAIRDYLSGAYGVLRNKYMHNDPPRNLAELEGALATVNLALTLIEPPPP